MNLRIVRCLLLMPLMSVGFLFIVDVTSLACAGQFDAEVKLTASDAGPPNQYSFADIFGFSVAISGERAIVGSPSDDTVVGDLAGSAYLFDVTTGQELFKLTASDAAQSDRFGQSVAISGNRAIIGGHFNDDVGDASGSAYLFDVTTGQELFKLTASDAASNDTFGNAVAISGNRAIIAAHFDDDKGFSSGSAYLFNVATGKQLFKLTASDGAAHDHFGESVAISGNRAIVGASEENFRTGSAYLFNVTTGKQLFKLTASDGAANDNFGISVMISGNTAIVGAPYDDDAGNASGSAYLFDVTTGDQLMKLTADDAAAADIFGRSVAISGNTAIVGAHGDNDAGNSSGSVYLFDVTTGEQLVKLSASDGTERDYFGFSVAISGNRAIAGAYGDDVANGGSGSAYLLAVPEPSSILLAAFGFVPLLVFRRRRNNGMSDGS